jgi:hypothetical protein
LVESKRNQHHKSILDSTYGIFLFGTPQQGFHAEQLERVVDARHNLIRQLKEGSEFLENQKEDLLPILECLKERKVVSFYETLNTTLVRNMIKILSPCTSSIGY